MEAFKEALKELARVVLLAVIPVVAIAVENNSVDWKTVGVVATVAALKFIDKFLHERSPEGTAGGLTRF